METRTFNVLPKTTFRWTRSNASDLKIAAVKAAVANAVWSGDTDFLTATDTDQVARSILSQTFTGAETTTFEETLSSSSEKYIIRIPSNHAAVLRVELLLDEVQCDWLGSIAIVLEENASLELVLVFKGTNNRKGQLNYSVLTSMGPESNLKITKVHCGMTTDTSIEHRYTKMEKFANAKFISAEFGAAQCIYHGDADLIGENAELFEECIYIADSEEHVDLYYDRNHYGKNTDSHLATYGALQGTGKKVFRGCIDFKKGASGATGNEEDYSILLSKDARNVSLPLLLCTEDDVEGNHATSAGQIDEDIMFYLMTRGFSRNEAKRMIVESLLRPVADLIEDEALREDVLQEIRMKME